MTVTIEHVDAHQQLIEAIRGREEAARQLGVARHQLDEMRAAEAGHDAQVKARLVREAREHVSKELAEATLELDRLRMALETAERKQPVARPQATSSTATASTASPASVDDRELKALESRLAKTEQARAKAEHARAEVEKVAVAAQRKVDELMTFYEKSEKEVRRSYAEVDEANARADASDAACVQLAEQNAEMAAEIAELRAKIEQYALHMGREATRREALSELSSIAATTVSDSLLPYRS
jgi:chromosome segregation ATPase